MTAALSFGNWIDNSGKRFFKIPDIEVKCRDSGLRVDKKMSEGIGCSGQ